MAAEELRGSFSDSSVRLFLRALWVARVPVASILAALLIFSQAEALDLFVDIPPDTLPRIVHWSLFYFVAILFWVLPANFSARVALQLNHRRIGIDTQRRYLLFVIGLPRLLSVACFVVIYYGFLQAWQHVPLVDKGTFSIAGEARNHLQLASYWALGLCVLVTLAYWVLAHLPLLKATHLRPVAPRLYDVLEATLRWLEPRQQRDAVAMFDAPAAAGQHNTLIAVFLLLTIGFAINVTLAVVFLWPRLTAWLGGVPLETYLPRAVFVPVLLGINVPGVTLLGVLSHRFRLPLILAFFLLLGTWGLFREDRHDARIAKSPAQRISLADAVARWRRAACASGGECQPIIVAGAGGASRAAFMTGNTLAYLEARFPEFKKRLFAVSTVSGSSLGGAAFAAGLALARADPPPRAEVCSDKRFQDWFACHSSAKRARLELEDERSAPQMRMQLFLANDFLTPVFVALTFSDTWRIGPDRAIKLEKSWERGWREVTENVSKDEGDFGKLLSEFLPNDTYGWRPLLLFNGTSVGTGRRIIVSSLEPTHNGRRLFTDAYDFYELACPGKDGAPPSCDLKLSTAVTMSARFPFVSPAGNITVEGAVADRIVDGGYFENSGAQTALELARALEKGFHLTPFILQITNDPSGLSYEDCRQPVNWEAQYEQRQPTRPFNFEAANLLSWLVDPLNTVVSTRAARGRQATAEALASVASENYAQIRVCPQRLDRSAEGSWERITERVATLLQRYTPGRRSAKDTRATDTFKELSASWWLSTPVQQYLHHELEAPHNCAEIAHLKKVLGPDAWNGPRARRECAEAEGR